MPLAQLLDHCPLFSCYVIQSKLLSILDLTHTHTSERLDDVQVNVCGCSQDWARYKDKCVENVIPPPP